MIKLLISVYVSIIIILDSAPRFVEVGAQIDFIKTMANFIQKLLW